MFPASPSWALCSPKNVVSLLHLLLFPLPLLRSCSWLYSLSMLWVLLSCRRQGAADKSKQPEPCTLGPAHHSTITPTLASHACYRQALPSLLPSDGSPPRSCWRKAEPPRPSSHLGAAVPFPWRSRTATKKPWVSVSAGEARRQLSAPEKAASPRQGQEGKAFTSL